MSDEQFWYLITRLFVLEHNPKLEKKWWFRLLKVGQGFGIFFVLLASLIIAYATFNSKTQTAATLICKDGTSWNAMDPSYQFIELDTYEKCGLCNKRNDDNTFNSCHYGESYQLLYDSYEVKRQYKKEFSLITVIFYTTAVLLIGLILVKVGVKIIIYILGGNVQRDEE